MIFVEKRKKTPPLTISMIQNCHLNWCTTRKIYILT